MRRGLKFLCTDTLKKKKQWRAVPDVKTVELFEDFLGNGGGPVKTTRDIERIGFTIDITNPDTVASCVPWAIPPG